MEEQWKDTAFLNYEVSTHGNVRSKKAGRVLKSYKNPAGYLIVSINGPVKKTYRVHRLVAETYIPNPERKPTVNHINGIKHDNRVEKLEWSTVEEQTYHSYKVMGRKTNLITPIPVILEKNGERHEFRSQQAACRFVNLSRTACYDALRAGCKLAGWTVYLKPISPSCNLE